MTASNRDDDADDSRVGWVRQKLTSGPQGCDEAMAPSEKCSLTVVSEICEEGRDWSLLATLILKWFGP